MYLCVFIMHIIVPTVPKRLDKYDAIPMCTCRWKPNDLMPC